MLSWRPGRNVTLVRFCWNARYGHSPQSYQINIPVEWETQGATKRWLSEHCCTQSLHLYLCLTGVLNLLQRILGHFLQWMFSFLEDTLPCTLQKITSRADKHLSWNLVPGYWFTLWISPQLSRRYAIYNWMNSAEIPFILVAICS